MGCHEQVGWKEESVSVEENKALIRRLYDEVFAKWNFGVVGELVGSEFVGHEMPPGTPRGPVGFRVQTMSPSVTDWTSTGIPSVR